MTGFPINGWDGLIEAINQLNNSWVSKTEDIPYKYTLFTASQTLDPSSPALICSLPEGDNYRIIVNNKSENLVFLYLGENGDKELSINNSAWEIKPKHGMILEGEKCVLWAIAQNFSNIVVTVHSTKPNLGENVTIALNVQLQVGTGDLLGQDIPLAELASVYSDWEFILQDIVESDQGITGHKLIHLKSFQPGNTYDFNVAVSPDFTDFEAGVAKPIKIHLLSFPRLIKAAVGAAAGMRGVPFSDLTALSRSLIGFAKSGGWVANLPPTGGAFSITPGNFENYIHIGAYTPGGSDACVITNFDESTNTFTLGGY